MIVEQLTLENFRQFAGHQKVDFATEPSRNVTVLHGYNGSGKTTLLNSFTWLFYGDFSPDFADTERLANEGAWAELEEGGQLSTAVEARFEHNGRHYIARRERVAEKLVDGAHRVIHDGTLRLRYVGEDGELHEVGGPEDHIQRILPPALSPFFFFNGERIERLASPTAYEEVETGVKVLLDIELLERAERHLTKNLAREYRDEIAEHAGAEGEALRVKRQKVDENLARLEGDLAQLNENERALEEQRERIDEKLSSAPELAELQKEREEKTIQQSEAKRALKEARADIARAVSDDGYLPLGGGVLDRALEVLDRAHEEGQLPPPMKRQFVEDLLEGGRCLCDRELADGTDERAAVEAWLERTRTDQFTQLATAMRADIRGALRQRGEAFWSRLDELQRRVERQRDSVRQLDERLSEISSQIGDEAPQEDFRALEIQRRKIEKQLTDLKVDAAKIRDDKKDLEEQGASLDREIQQLDRADEQGKLVQKRLDAVLKVGEAIRKICEIRQQTLRSSVSEKLSEIWNEISIKDYRAHLDENYRLRLTKELGGQEEEVRGASTGEKQVLSLAFVASLVREANRTHEERQNRSAGLFTGGQYPLVMDSPFGSLEVEYRREVARWMPELAPQIVVMVSETQWRNEVEEQLMGRVGKAYVLTCHTAKHSEKPIELRGREYPYVRQSANGYERTEVTEVTD